MQYLSELEKLMTEVFRVAMFHLFASLAIPNLLFDFIMPYFPVFERFEHTTNKWLHVFLCAGLLLLVGVFIDVFVLIVIDHLKDFKLERS